ncbi:hypothetical protein [Micromonospora aurantiaca (nom. illeg.)]|uniref:hypothetical protein n=1 Tax=Micromonospora aurantiaca (nom. illeg.) TaxID=47850 RepID=UPI00119EB20C
MMNSADGEAFAEAVLQRVAELAYEELRPHLGAYALARQSTPTTGTRTTPTPSRPGDELAARRARRRSA